MSDTGDIVDKLPPAGDRFKWANDKELIEVAIGFSFKTFCKLDTIGIKVKYGEVCGGYFGGFLGKPSYMIFSYTRKISKSLFEELDLWNATSIILGYISEVLPYINNEIVFQKKQNFNLLVKRYSTLDIENIIVSDNYGNTKKLDWPLIFGNFPFENKIQDVYFHDLIGAIQSYYCTDYNEALRKLITSIDSYMKKNGWKAEEHKKGFKSKLDNAFKNSDSFVSTIINDIKYMYDIRNYIVHEGKTINPLDSWFIDRAIGCVFYFYKFVSKTQEASDFFLQLEQHFISIRDSLLGEDLSDFLNNKKTKVKEINTPKDIVDMIERGFKITEKDITCIKNNLIDAYF